MHTCMLIEINKNKTNPAPPDHSFTHSAAEARRCVHTSNACLHEVLRGPTMTRLWTALRVSEASFLHRVYNFAANNIVDLVKAMAQHCASIDASQSALLSRDNPCTFELSSRLLATGKRQLFVVSK